MLLTLRKFKLGIHPDHSNHVEPLLEKYQVAHTSSFYSSEIEGYDICKKYYDCTVDGDRFADLISELRTLPILVSLSY